MSHPSSDAQSSISVTPVRVNGNVIMSGCEDDDTDDERREAAGAD